MSAYALTDSATMLRRNLRHALRYPSMTFSTLATPVLMLLLFNYAFGGALEAGIGGGAYIDYIAPGIILVGATAGSVATAVAVNVDMTEGIVNRFRTMAISRGSILTGHVIGSAIQTMASVVIVIAVALAIGFRPTANALEWLGVIGLLDAGDVRAHVAVGRVRRDGPEPGGGEQRADAAAVPAAARLGDRARPRRCRPRCGTSPSTSRSRRSSRRCAAC